MTQDYDIEAGLRRIMECGPYEGEATIRAELGKALAIYPCTHRIADARNTYVQSGYLCVDCGALFAAFNHAK